MSPGPIQLDQATALTLMLGPNGSVGIQASVAWFAVSDTGTLAVARGTRERNRLLWIDRQGQSRPATEDRGDFWNPRLSPDGRRVAATIQDGPNQSIWIYDLDRGTRIRLTTEGRYNLFPVWSPDARWIALGSDRTGPMSAFRMRSDGSGEAEPILEEGTNAVAESWSSDGRYLAFDTIAGLNIIVLPLLEDGPPFSFLQTRFFNQSPRFSPDTRFLAYVSDESGQREVYVTPFPEPGEKFPISTGGGRAPVWSRDGRELFYRNGREMMAVSVELKPKVEHGRPERLFEGDFVVEPYGFHDYDVSLDAEHFLMIESAPEASPKELHVVLDWFQELERLAPTEQ